MNDNIAPMLFELQLVTGVSWLRVAFYNFDFLLLSLQSGGQNFCVHHLSP